MKGMALPHQTGRVRGAICRTPNRLADHFAPFRNSN